MASPAIRAHLFACHLTAAGLTAAAVAVPAAVDTAATVASCDAFRAPRATTAGAAVGQERCVMQARVVTDTSWPEVSAVLGGAGRKYHRLDVGVTGTLSGSV